LSSDIYRILSQGLFAEGWGNTKLNKKVQLALADDEMFS
jgi:hypothetical protein